MISLTNEENILKKKELLFKNIKYDSKEIIRKDKEKNKFIYNVYIEYK